MMDVIYCKKRQVAIEEPQCLFFFVRLKGIINFFQNV